MLLFKKPGPKQKLTVSAFCVCRFQGAPYRSTCLLQPTSSSLVNVTEWVSGPAGLNLPRQMWLAR